VTSLASARIDAGPAGTLDASWYLYSGGTPAGTAAMGVKTVGNVIYAGCQVKSSGLANNATIKLKYTEYDSSGVATGASGTLQTFTVASAVQAAWGAAGSYTLSGHWTTGASCAFVGVSVQVQDSTSGSVNAIVWLDNAQVWNSTVSNTTAMPYCELRFGNSPAQLLLSGLLGDMAAPASYLFGTRSAGFTGPGNVSFYIGIRERAGATAQLVSGGDQFYCNTLDTSAFYGAKATMTGGLSYSFAGRSNRQTLSDMLGAYRLLIRMSSAATAPTNLAALTIQPTSTMVYGATALQVASGKLIAAPIVASSTTQVTDAGLLTAPMFDVGVGLDQTGVGVNFSESFADPSSANAIFNYDALMPADENGTLVTGQMTFTTGSWSGVMQGYVDGSDMQLQRTDIDVSSTMYWTLTYTTDLTPEKGIAGAAFGGVQVTMGINLGQDSVPQVYPLAKVGSTSGVNQGVGLIYDPSANVMPFIMDVVYSPLYLYPRS
jgi:hypothetical protein